MKILTKIIGAACLAGALAGASVVPAQAQAFSFGFGFGNGGFGFNNYDRGYRGYRGYDYGFRNRHYVPRSNFGFSINVAPRGRAFISASHVQRCEARFQSYNRRTDLYLGFDGDYHRCTL